ncbi:MAG: NTP transferase domain-containing protein [Candidatus Aenigmarchaeota archaeon]|nr:NTP transferase domain-containing protein [Candidatus Aenigmarchaeota archaeon]
MKAVILAGGGSSRFWPLAEGGHKSLIRIAGKTLLEHTIESLIGNGVNERDLVIVHSPSNGGLIKDVLKERELDFAVQKEPLGMGNALACAKENISGEFIVTHAHHFDAGHILSSYLRHIKNGPAVAVVKGDVADYGMVTVGKGFAKGIEEKTGKAKVGYRAVGFYILSEEFFGIYDRQKKHEYDFEAALSEYMEGADMRVIGMKDSVTLKYPWHLHDCAAKLLKSRSMISSEARIAKNAVIKGNVVIDAGTFVNENAVIKGPVYIGRGCIIGNNAIVRENADIEEGCIIGANSEVARSIFQKGCSIHSGFFGDSIFDAGCKAGAGMITANKRIDRGQIRCEVKGKKIETGRKRLGVIAGKNASFGIGCETMPGVLIGSDCSAYPGSIIKENVPSGHEVRTEIKQVLRRRG